MFYLRQEGGVGGRKERGKRKKEKGKKEGREGRMKEKKERKKRERERILIWPSLPKLSVGPDHSSHFTPDFSARGRKHSPLG